MVKIAPTMRNDYFLINCTEQKGYQSLRFRCYHFGPHSQMSLYFQIQDENSINDSHASLMIGGQATRVYQ